MTKKRTLQILRGTTAQNDAYTGFAGELTMDTTLNELRVHDGNTPGGHKIGGGYHPDLFTWQWADHELNDVQWLRADTFSWQSGAVYQAAYQHLVDDIDGKTLQSETVGGTTIQFYLADDGHKICPASQESNVAAIYNATGVAWYYILDTTNQRFKLPRRHSQQIVRSVKNADSSWYRLYADGWVEQGGILSVASTSQATAALAAPMLDTNYTITNGFQDTSGSKRDNPLMILGVSTTSITLGHNAGGTMKCHWQVSGQSAIDMSSFQNGERYLYFYVGNFTQTALENTAGLNTELFNGKADLNLSNTASNIDFVVESQEPTSANNYTWYRKYRSGWVEQGGQAENKTVSLPITMSDANYETIINVLYNNNGGTIYSELGYVSKTTTSFTKSGNATVFNWMVYGIAA